MTCEFHPLTTHPIILIILVLYIRHDMLHTTLPQRFTPLHSTSISISLYWDHCWLKRRGGGRNAIRIHWQCDSRPQQMAQVSCVHELRRTLGRKVGRTGSIQLRWNARIRSGSTHRCPAHRLLCQDTLVEGLCGTMRIKLAVYKR